MYIGDCTDKEILEKCKELQKTYSPFITIVEELPEIKKRGKLAGIAVSVKDCICTAGLQSTAGSRILQGYIPPMDATAVERVKAAGGVIIGKTAQDEFGFGTFSINCAYGVPKNPHDVERTCGGSSGGAACLTAAADFPHIALAESTGGSISCPAAFCGVVGLTPTYGLVSRWGLIDYANSLDKIGAIGKSVADVARMLTVIAGYDERDATSLRVKPQDYTKYLRKSVKGRSLKSICIGVPDEYFERGVDGRIVKLVLNGIKSLESLGCSVKQISLPHTRYALAAYYIIALAEASTNLAKFCGMRYGLQGILRGNYDKYFSIVRSAGFGEEAKRRIILGTYARMAGYRDAYYLKALKVRTKVIEDFKAAFASCDVLIAPTMPVVAPRFDEIAKLEPIEQYMMDILTVAPNLAGIPMISVPCGFVNEHGSKLPVGLHIMADHLQEGRMLQVAYAFEQLMKKKGNENSRGD